MKAQWTRYLVVALFACLLGALAHASISRAVQGRGSDSAPDTWRTAAESSRLEVQPTGRQAGERRDDRKKPQDTLLRKLWDLLEEAKDLSSGERKQAFDILEEADPILTRIKKENEQAIEILKNPPRQIIRPAPKRDKQQPTPDASDEDSAGP